MLTGARSRITRRIPLAVAMASVVAATLLAGGVPATAGAQTAAGSGSYGGTQFYARAVIQVLRCQTLCPRAVSASSTGWVSVKEKGILRIRGRNSGDVGQVLVLGSAGKGDNVGVKPLARTSRTVDVKVPMQAGSGKLVLLDPAGRSSRPSPTRLRIVRTANSLSA